MARASAGLLVLACPLLCLACGEEPRDLVLVSVDTLRADHLGAYGDGRGLTPHLDALAAESIRYERAYAPVPLTLPSLAGLLTGHHPDDLGVRDNVSRLPAGVTTLAQRLHEHGFRTGAVVANGIAREYTGLATGFEIYDVQFTLDWRPGAEERTALTTDVALHVADALRQGRPGPLFLWVHYLDPHGPYEPEDADRERLLAGERQRSDGGRLLEVSPNSRGLGAIPRYQYQAPHHEVAWYRAGYAGEVARVDREVGRLLEGLAARGILERAVLVFTADHGEALGEDDYWFAHGERLGDASVRVPLLIRVPGRPPEVRPELASLLDVAPTLAHLAGVPWEDASGIDLLGAAAGRPRSLLLATGEAASSSPGRALVGSEWKLVRRGDEESLFHLPDETHDLRAQFEPLARALGAELDARTAPK
jgi:arylsulfatase A-like enzyme